MRFVLEGLLEWGAIAVVLFLLVTWIPYGLTTPAAWSAARRLRGWWRIV